jgi:hypothetical protein
VCGCDALYGPCGGAPHEWKDELLEVTMRDLDAHVPHQYFPSFSVVVVALAFFHFLQIRDYMLENTILHWEPPVRNAAAQILEACLWGRHSRVPFAAWVKKYSWALARAFLYADIPEVCPWVWVKKYPFSTSTH